MVLLVTESLLQLFSRTRLAPRYVCVGGQLAPISLYVASSWLEAALG